MSLFSKIIKALNQSFKLIFVAIGKGIRAVYHFAKKLMHLLSKVIKLLHNAIASIIQIAINVSSAVFVLFIPVIFFLDPLNWSRHLESVVSNQPLFVMRMLLGAFFSIVAFFLVKELYKSLKESEESNEEKNKEKRREDFVGIISKILAWLVILVLLLYFTVFRYQFIPMELYYQHLPTWVQDLLIKLYAK